MHRTLESFRELKSKGDEYLCILQEKGVKGIYLCGEDDLTEILSFCFTGVKIELLSIISEKILLTDTEQKSDLEIPKLKTGELIMVASLENQDLISKLLIHQGLIKNKHWVVFS